MQKTLQVEKTKWTFIQTPDKPTIDKLAQEYGFHEMIVDDILEVNAQSKIDTSSNHFFLALTFTKYVPTESKHIFNELDVIIGENHIVTTIGLESQSLNKVFDDIAKEAEKFKWAYIVNRQKNEWNDAVLDDWVIPTTWESVGTNAVKWSQVSKAVEYKASPYYILYRIIDAFYDKTIQSLTFSSQKLLDIQTNIGSKWEDVIDDLINEDLNKIFIKHNFLSQEEIIDELIDHVGKFHEKHLTTYFNDLKTKLAKIVRTIKVLTEKNDSLMAAYNTFLSIKSNKSVTRLTFVNSIFMPLTVIAGIGGMSERSMMTGSQNRRITYPLFIILCLIIAYITYLLLRRYFMKK